MNVLADSQKSLENVVITGFDSLLSLTKGDDYLLDNNFQWGDFMSVNNENRTENILSNKTVSERRSVKSIENIDFSSIFGIDTNNEDTNNDDINNEDVNNENTNEENTNEENTNEEDVNNENTNEEDTNEEDANNENTNEEDTNDEDTNEEDTNDEDTDEIDDFDFD